MREFKVYDEKSEEEDEDEASNTHYIYVGTKVPEANELSAKHF